MAEKIAGLVSREACLDATVHPTVEDRFSNCTAAHCNGVNLYRAGPERFRRKCDG